MTDRGEIDNRSHSAYSPFQFLREKRYTIKFLLTTRHFAEDIRLPAPQISTGKTPVYLIQSKENSELPFLPQTDGRAPANKYAPNSRPFLFAWGGTRNSVRSGCPVPFTLAAKRTTRHPASRRDGLRFISACNPNYDDEHGGLSGEDGVDLSWR